MRYLLGDLSEDEKTRMEEAFFADDAKFEELELAEEELIDGYVRDQLSPEEQRQFKARLLRSPRLVERVNFARVLAERVDSASALEAEESISPALVTIPPAPKPRRWWAGLFSKQPAFRAAVAAYVILLLVGGGPLFYGWLRLRGESERLASERTTLQRQKEELDRQLREKRGENEQLTADLKRRSDQLAEALRQIEARESGQKRKELEQPILGSISFTLTRGSLRSEGRANEVSIDRNTSQVELKLPLESDDYRSYRVIVENVDDGKIVADRNLKAQKTNSGQQLILQIPARRLRPRNYYTIKVTGRTPSGLEDVDDFGFHVTMK